MQYFKNYSAFKGWPISFLKILTEKKKTSSNSSAIYVTFRGKNSSFYENLFHETLDESINLSSSWFICQPGKHATRYISKSKDASDFHICFLTFSWILWEQLPRKSTSKPSLAKNSVGSLPGYALHEAHYTWAIPIDRIWMELHFQAF